PGIFLNAFLLYLIKRFSRKDLGAYKYLLGIFALYDIILIIMHNLIDLKAVITEHFFGVISVNFLNTSKFTSIYGACFMVPFSLLNIHFLYRYWVIKYPYRVAFFSRPKFIVLLVFCISIITFFWYCICEYGLDTTEPGYLEARLELAAEFNLSYIDGWFVFQHDGEISLRTVATLLTYDAVMVVMSMTSVSLALLTYLQIQREKTLSFNDRHSQLRILFAVCIQTLVPFIFVYAPYLSFFNLPLLGFRAPTIAADIAPYVHSVFPMLDALVIILLMKDYRNGARFILFGRKEEQVVSIASQVSAINSQPSLSRSIQLLISLKTWRKRAKKAKRVLQIPQWSPLK
ncbi:hypothetical protein PRIPAC_74171, partial [Pristionchus pacificus]|uniref:G protein-coupled receptor n=1 Tax=Pristionchus pacificus TaxID=54126 RepID=A0A2A6C5E5_PRIPA